VTECLQSVMDQDYRNYELIVVDDGSTDGSVAAIELFKKKFPEIVVVKLEKNIGICKAFNTAFKMSSGDLLIDLAADDVLFPTRLSRGVETFRYADADCGVVFGDAEWIDEDGHHLYFHSQKFPHDNVPRGNIYKDLVERYFICSPTMMFRRTVVDFMNGYDESLTYEDFDFWIRSSRRFKYHYDPEVQVKKRKVRNSLSHEQFKILNKHSKSTYRVCTKILDLNRSEAERRATSKRLQYEIRQSIRTLDIVLAYKYLVLWIRNKNFSLNL
jgi:glycosyltransferase involved in cell wall biosynthesis